MKSTTELLKQLRNLMQDTKYVPVPLQAYIVTSQDAHNSEYVSSCDKRRAFISGFTGSNGTAVITLKEALMWTDGRFYEQSLKEMDSNWQLMKRSALSIENYLSRNLPPASAIGADPRYITFDKWCTLEKEFEDNNKKFVAVQINLIDILWIGKPPRPKNPVKPLPIKYSGKPAGEKLATVRNEMKKSKANLLVVIALDEIAWVLNLRGSDISYNPVFFSYLLVKMDSISLYVDGSQVSNDVVTHLNNEIGETNYKILPYEKISCDLKATIGNVDGMVWISDEATHLLAKSIPVDRRILRMTPIALLKVVKNEVEIAGMRNAHIKDSVAICCYLAWLEKNVGKCAAITEITGAELLHDFRKEQEGYVGPSFEAISSVGDHAAIIHYKPSPSTDVKISKDAMYLIDSGGQYLDGTTDITRTVHLGTPSKEEIQCATLVLKGVINTATCVFPAKTASKRLDCLGREYLWNVGLNYNHGTSHGVGSYLYVHEYCGNLDIGMFLSNEPGFYESGKFGFRHEDVIEVVEANTPYNYGEVGFRTFSTVSLIPPYRKLIAVDMLTKNEIDYLNGYCKKCRDIVGPLLDAAGKTDAKEWLWRETDPIKK